MKNEGSLTVVSDGKSYTVSKCQSNLKVMHDFIEQAFWIENEQKEGMQVTAQDLFDMLDEYFIWRI